ncbi:hypothetical protein K505DRAFT_240677, partial [Melanomma pulvis-pyrius CBS 109.77]
YIDHSCFSSRPCIRGHRASKCDHRDRILIEVRKPGRPLTSCPHVSGPCGCEHRVTDVAIATGKAFFVVVGPLANFHQNLVTEIFQ